MQAKGGNTLQCCYTLHTYLPTQLSEAPLKTVHITGIKKSMSSQPSKILFCKPVQATRNQAKLHSLINPVFNMLRSCQLSEKQTPHNKRPKHQANKVPAMNTTLKDMF
jgi:hypothetical protein